MYVPINGLKFIDKNNIKEGDYFVLGGCTVRCTKQATSSAWLTLCWFFSDRRRIVEWMCFNFLTNLIWWGIITLIGETVLHPSSRYFMPHP